MKFMKTATINSLLFIGVYTTMVLVCIGVNTMIDVKFLAAKNSISGDMIIVRLIFFVPFA
jgi:hypothetical protein